MVSGTYQAYERICLMILELITEYYDEPRKFRITNQNGETEYIEYSNQNLVPQPIPGDLTGTTPRKPIFDVSVRAEKYTPTASLAQNELAKELFAAGFFNPEMAAASLTAMELMSFEGKDRIVKMIQQRYDEIMGVQQAQADAQGNQDIIAQMAQVIMEMGGPDILAGTTGPAGQMALPQGGLPQ
jgi:hypothetical protein